MFVRPHHKYIIVYQYHIIIIPTGYLSGPVLLVISGWRWRGLCHCQSDGCSETGGTHRDRFQTPKRIQKVFYGLENPRVQTHICEKCVFFFCRDQKTLAFLKFCSTPDHDKRVQLMARYAPRQGFPDFESDGQPSISRRNSDSQAAHVGILVRKLDFVDFGSKGVAKKDEKRQTLF